MLINEVESVVGVSKKSIRYYESVGLFSPKRHQSNDYRDYSDEDVILLKKIKFLRELDVSINDLKRLKNEELSLKDLSLAELKNLAKEKGIKGYTKMNKEELIKELEK